MNRSKDKGFGRGGRDRESERMNAVEKGVEEEEGIDIDGRGGQEKGRGFAGPKPVTPSSDTRPK